MKVIKTTKKYLHVRISKEEYSLFSKALTTQALEKEKEERKLEWAKWFFSNHIEESWEDEYGSNHTYWIDINTGKDVHTPDYFLLSCYRYRYLDTIKETKKKWDEKKTNNRCF